jgi:outer membrane protein assembly factor BamB
LWAGAAAPLSAQPIGSVAGSQFELADTVQLDQVDQAVLAQWERAKALLADRQWDEALDILGQLAESSEGKLLAVTNCRYLSLRACCQLQLAALPPDALKLYRQRVDPIAKKWYEQGIAQRNRAALEKIVDRAFASRYGDKALMALGEMALEAGDFAAARWYWERVLPSTPPAGTPRIWPGYPDTDLDLAAVRARLVLVSILEGKKGTNPTSRDGPEGAAHKLDSSSSSSRATEELAAFVRLHGEAQGRLGGHEGKYADLLGALLADSVAWPPAASDPNWVTFAGNSRRNRIASRLSDVGAIAWRLPLRPAPAAGDRLFEPPGASENPREPLSFHPLQLGNLVLVNDSLRILALRLDTGQPAWGRAAIYESQLSGPAAPRLPPEMLGSPRFTLTCFEDKLFARMGSPVTGQPQGGTTPLRPGCLVCLDLAAEGRLVWKIAPEEGWAFEGSPVADARGLYVAMRRQDIRPQVSVACFDADNGRLRWRRFVCGAETPARGVYYESTHHLLTLSGDTLYYNTNLGAVAALRADDGYPLWVSLYPRARRGDLARLAPHWRRDLNPCLFDDGTLLVAPADSPRIFAFDAATGHMLWQTGSEVEDAEHLLGVAGQWLIAGGRKLYWISLKEEDRGRVKHVWPETSDQPPGYGRGVLAGSDVLWPTRDKLYIFDQQTAEPRKVVDLRARGASGGNLLPAGGQLLIATETELIAVGPHGRDAPPGSAPPLAVAAHQP